MDSGSSTPAPTVKVITVTNGTANAGENVEISKLSAYLSTRGGKLYAELACTTEVAIASVKAGSTYYAKVTSTTPTTGGTDVFVVTYYLTSNDVSSKTKVAEQKMQNTVFLIFPQLLEHTLSPKMARPTLSQLLQRVPTQ